MIKKGLHIILIFIVCVKPFASKGNNLSVITESSETVICHFYEDSNAHKSDVLSHGDLNAQRAYSTHLFAFADSSSDEEQITYSLSSCVFRSKEFHNKNTYPTHIPPSLSFNYQVCFQVFRC